VSSLITVSLAFDFFAAHLKLKGKGKSQNGRGKRMKEVIRNALDRSDRNRFEGYEVA
jgi:hypothetical protein